MAPVRPVSSRCRLSTAKPPRAGKKFSTVKLALLGGLACAVLLPIACSSAPSRPLGDDSVPITDNVQLQNLAGPVDAVRDSFGMIHIYATNVPDALRVMGYQMGRDRHVQLELLRRVAEGRMAEAFGDLSPSLIDDDIVARTIGLTRVAQQMCDALDPNGPEKQALDAFADGVSQYYARVQSGDEALPKGVVGFSQSLLTPWTCVDSLAIARYQSEALSFDADSDIGRQNFLDAAQTKFVSTSSDPEVLKRVGLERDMLRFAPLDPTLVLPGGFPNDPNLSQDVIVPRTRPRPTDVPKRIVLGHRLSSAVDGWLHAQRSIDQIFAKVGTRGSNDWVLGPSLTADGHPLVCNDPHLSLTAPSVFWMVHLSVHAPAGQDSSQDLEVAGLAFPGIPVVILGENEHVAWGATTTGYDVTDVYKETLSPDGSSVTFNGQQVPIQKIHETINVAHGSPVEYDVLYVPHHGPIIPDIVNHAVVPPDPAQGALSYRWTGLDPSNEVAAINNFQRAKSVDDVRTAMRDFAVGAQNWVSADDQGNIFYTSQGRIPKRSDGALAWDASTYQGTLPMFVLPGDGSAEWTGDLEEAYVPHVKNPTQGFVATANADQVGVTLDNDPSNDLAPNGERVYIGGDFDVGFRVGRITKRIQNLGHPATPDDMASIQADVHSPYGELLAPKLVAAIAAAEEERTSPGTHPDLTAVVADSRYAGANVSEISQWMTSWGTDSDYSSESGVSDDDNSLLTDPKLMTAAQATLVFETWMVRMGMLTFDDEVAVLGTKGPASIPRMLAYIWTAPDPTKLATYDATTGESALFDDMTTTSVTETSNQLAIEALLDALDYLDTTFGSDRSQWRWGRAHTLTFGALVPLWGSLSIPQSGNTIFPNGFPRHGDNSTVDVGNFGTNPSALAGLDFTYGEGPTQRLVADVQSPAPVSRNALPGGEVWDNTSPYFDNEAERWRRNQNRPVWILKSDVIADAQERIAYDP
jgi:penicillin amidase